MDSIVLSIVLILVLQNQHLGGHSAAAFVPRLHLGKEDLTTMSCSDFIPKKNFDIQKFLGTWQILETHTERGDAVANCMGVGITEAPINGTYVTDIFLNTNMKRKSLLMQYLKVPMGNGYLDVLTGSLEADQDYAILETTVGVMDSGWEYYNTALLLTCKDTNFDGVTDLIEIDILSRGLGLPLNVFENYVNILETYGIVAEFVSTEQESCP